MYTQIFSKVLKHPNTIQYSYRCYKWEQIGSWGEQFVSQMRSEP